jgi:HIT domain
MSSQIPYSPPDHSTLLFPTRFKIPDKPPSDGRMSGVFFDEDSMQGTPVRGHASIKKHDDQEAWDYDDSCPFCRIATSYRPMHPLSTPEKLTDEFDPDKTDPACMMIYSGYNVLAFLDIQPLTFGHVLVIPRRHKTKMGDLYDWDGASVSTRLPVFKFFPSREVNKENIKRIYLFPTISTLRVV